MDSVELYFLIVISIGVFWDAASSYEHRMAQARRTNLVLDEIQKVLKKLQGGEPC